MYVRMVCLSFVCVRVYTHTYACHNTCPMTTLGVSSCLSSCWRRLSLVLAAAHTGAGRLQVSGASLVSSSHLTLGTPALQTLYSSGSKFKPS